MLQNYKPGILVVKSKRELVLNYLCLIYLFDLLQFDQEETQNLQYYDVWKSVLNPNLPDPVNFVPFGTMRYSIFDINLMSLGL